MYNLNLYLKTLEQRNNYLRQIKEEKKDENLLDIWDEKLVEYADNIYKYRKDFIEKIKNKIKKFIKKLQIIKKKQKLNILQNVKVKKLTYRY